MISPSSHSSPMKIGDKELREAGGIPITEATPGMIIETLYKSIYGEGVVATGRYYLVIERLDGSRGKIRCAKRFNQGLMDLHWTCAVREIDPKTIDGF